MTVSAIRKVSNSVARRIKYNLHPRAIIWRYWQKHCSDKPIVTSLDMGLKVRVYPHDVIGKYIYINRRVERQVWAFIKKHLKPGMVVFDLGANLGQYTLLAAKSVGEKGWVHSFEPSERVFKELQFNISLNGLTDNCILNRMAVSDKNGRAKLSRYQPGAEVYGSLGYHQRKEGTVIGYEEVETVRLDDYVEKNSIRWVDLIKMDIEGAELLALRGAQNLLSRSDGPVILLELSDVNIAGFGYNAVETWHYLKDLGYRMYSIGRSGKIFRIIQPPKRFFPGRNLLAMKSTPQNV